MTGLVHRFALVLLALAAVVLAFVVVRFVDRILDRRATKRLVEGAVADAYAAYAGYVQQRAGAVLLDEYATEYPMRQRPESPVAAPGEPWRLRPAVGAHDAGLVEPGVPNDNPLGEQR